MKDRLNTKTFTRSQNHFLYGVFETESLEFTSVRRDGGKLIHTGLLEYLLKYLDHKKIENHPECKNEVGDSQIWTVNYIKIPMLNSSDLSKLLYNMQCALYPGWYSFFWSDRFFHIVFKNGIANIENDSKKADKALGVFLTSDQLEPFDQLFKANEVDIGYMYRNLNKVMREFK